MSLLQFGFSKSKRSRFDDGAVTAGSSANKEVLMDTTTAQLTKEKQGKAYC
jgi:hypothetical protein